MMITAVLLESHPVSRLLLGFGLLLLSITSQTLWSGLLLTVLACAMIRMLDGHWQSSMRMFRLLRWFVIPVLLLHALFSPGRLLFPGFVIAISQEGLVQGLWLSIHLTSIFSIALLFFRLLKHREWLACFHRLPIVGEQLVSQMFMMTVMKKNMTGLLLHLRMQYNLRKEWQQLPLLFIASVRLALADASAYAQQLWLRWPAQVPSHETIQQQQGGLGYSIMLALAGCMGVILAWL